MTAHRPASGESHDAASDLPHVLLKWEGCTMELRYSPLAFAAGLALGIGAASADDLKFPIGGDAKFNWKSLADFKAAHGDPKGQALTIFGPWRGEDDTLFRSVLAYFVDATGIDVKYSSS